MQRKGTANEAEWQSGTPPPSTTTFPRNCIAFRTHNTELCAAFCRGNKKHCTEFSTADNKPCKNPSTPTWRAGDEENGEGQFGGVSHFPSESDPLPRKRIKNKNKKKKIRKSLNDSQIKCLAAPWSTVSAKKTSLKRRDWAWILNIPGKASRTSPKQKRRGRGGGWRGGGDRCWYFQVYSRAMEDDLLAFKPGL